MRRNPALIDLHLFLAKTKVAQIKISSDSSPAKLEENQSEKLDTSTSQQ